MASAHSASVSAVSTAHSTPTHSPFYHTRTIAPIAAENNGTIRTVPALTVDTGRSESAPSSSSVSHVWQTHTVASPAVPKALRSDSSNASASVLNAVPVADRLARCRVTLRRLWRRVDLRFSKPHEEEIFVLNQCALNKARLAPLAFTWLVWELVIAGYESFAFPQMFIHIACVAFITVVAALSLKPALLSLKWLNKIQMMAFILLQAEQSALQIAYNYGEDRYCDNLNSSYSYSQGALPFIALSFFDLPMLQSVSIALTQCIGYVFFFLISHNHPCVRRNWMTIFFLAFFVSFAGWLRERSERRRFTQWYRTNRDLAASVVKEQKANDNKKQFLSYIHHELRTQFAAIVMAIDCASDLPGSTNTDMTDLLSLMSTQAECVSRILDDVLMMNRLEAGRFHLELIPFTLRSLIEGVMFSHKLMFSECDIALSLDCSGGMDLDSTILADPHRLRQVLANLIQNAKKFTPAGGSVTLRLSFASDSERERLETCGTSADTSNAGTLTKSKSLGVTHSLAHRLCLRFAVIDTGVGISAEDQSKLFQPYSQIRAGLLQAGGGSGLGLALCAAIIQLHGGFIECHSEPEQGAEFAFVLAFERPSRAVMNNFIAVKSPSSRKPPFTFHRTISNTAMSHNTVSELPGTVTPSTQPIIASARLQSLVNLASVPVSASISPRSNSSLRPSTRTTHTHQAINGTGVSNSGFYTMSSGASNSGNGDGTNSNSPHRTSVDHATAIANVTVLTATTVDTVTINRANSNTSANVPALSSAANTPARNAMVVEDSLPNQKLLARLLTTKFHYTVKVANNGQEALDLIAEHGADYFALIMIDRTMPVMNGIEATIQLRQTLHITCPILALTGNALPEDQQELIEAGCDKVLTKPASAKQIQEALDSLHGLR